MDGDGDGRNPLSYYVTRTFLPFRSTIVVYTPTLQCEVITYFLFRELPERRFNTPSYPTDLSLLKLRKCWDSNHTNLDRLLGHLSLKAFFKCQQRRVYRVL